MQIHLFSSPGEHGIEDILEAARLTLANKPDPTDLENIVRSEVQRRFPALCIEELYVPYIGRDVTITLDDEPEPMPAVPVPELEPLAADGSKF